VSDEYAFTDATYAAACAPTIAPMYRWLVRRRISRFSRSGVVRPDLAPDGLGKLVNAKMSVRAASRCSATAGSLSARASRMRSNWACTASASGWSSTDCSNAFTQPQAFFGVADMRFAA
jgi:hypothetical protein